MRKRNDGFTLVELMVVVLIMGILVAVAVPVFRAAKSSAEANTCKANQRTVLGAIQAYNAANATPLAAPGPPTVETLMNGTWLGYAWLGRGSELYTGSTPSVGQPLFSAYLKSIPLCPKARWGANDSHLRQGYRVHIDGGTYKIDYDHIVDATRTGEDLSAGMYSGHGL